MEPLQLVILLLIALLLLGGSHLPDAMRTLRAVRRDTVSRRFGLLPLRILGHNRRGVPILEGDPVIPGWRECTENAIHVFAVALAGWICVSDWLGGWSANSARTLHAVGWALLAIACVMGVTAVGSFLSSRLFAGLEPLETLSERFGRAELALLLEARARGIEPRVIINGREYFRVEDLGEAGILLRPAPAPEPISLLRPAQLHDSDERLLLRSSAGPPGESDGPP